MSTNLNVEAITAFIENLVVSLGVWRNNDHFEDCVQEPWLGVLKLSRRRQRSQAYLKQAALWSVRAYLRHERVRLRHAGNLPLHELHSLEEMIMRRWTRDHEAMLLGQSLSPRELLVYVLWIYSPMTQKQIGHLLGVTSRTVQRTIGTVRRKAAYLDAVISADDAWGAGRVSASGILA